MTNEIEQKLFSIARLAHRLEVEPRKYETDDVLTGADIHLIEIIGTNAGVSVTDIARLIGVTKGAVSQKLKYLEALGLAQKSEAFENRSRFVVTLTKKGMNAYNAHEKWHEKFDGGFKKYSEKLSNEKQEIIIEFLTKIEALFTRMLATDL